MDSHASVSNSNNPGKNPFLQKTQHLFIMLDAGLPNSTPHHSWAGVVLLHVLVQNTVYYGQEAKEEHLMSIWPRSRRTLDVTAQEFTELGPHIQTFQGAS